MGFFSEVKEDLSQAVNELVPSEEVEVEVEEVEVEEIAAVGNLSDTEALFEAAEAEFEEELEAKNLEATADLAVEVPLVGIAEVVEEEMKKLESGAWDVFFGPVKDQNGTVRVQEGESMTDDVMLNKFDWYVEGIMIDEQ